MGSMHFSFLRNLSVIINYKPSQIPDMEKLLKKNMGNMRGLKRVAFHTRHRRN